MKTRKGKRSIEVKNLENENDAFDNEYNSSGYLVPIAITIVDDTTYILLAYTFLYIYIIYTNGEKHGIALNKQKKEI